MSLFGAALLGAIAMYVYDSRSGRSRRAVMRYKTRSLLERANNTVDVAARGTAARLRGVQAHVMRLISRDKNTTDDRVLMERVRSKLGRVVSHPHAIDVIAWQGRVTLRGPVLAREAAALMAAVRSVSGVKNVENRLEVHDRPNHIPALQGGDRQRMSLAHRRGHWPPTLRGGTIIGGGALVLYDLAQHRVPQGLLASLGLGLIVRGVIDQPMSEIIGQVRPHRPIDLSKTIHVAVSPEVAFDVLSRYENFPRFMSHVEEVRDLGAGRSHWIIKGPAGGHIEWDAVITHSIRPRVLAWRSEPGALVEHIGHIWLEPMSGGTRIVLKTSYRPSATLGNAFTGLLDSELQQRKDDDVMRMKKIMERDSSSSDRQIGPSAT